MGNHKETLDLMQQIQQSDNSLPNAQMLNSQVARWSVAEETDLYPMIAKVIPDGENGGRKILRNIIS
jgi:hypothetical protein